jgi:hypothetical protein
MENRCDSDGGSTLHMEIVTIMRKRQNGAMKPRLGEGDREAVTPKGEIDHKGTNQSQVGNSLVNHSEASRKSQLAKWDGMSESST